LQQPKSGAVCRFLDPLQQVKPEFDIGIARLLALSCAASYEQATIADRGTDTQVLIQQMPEQTVVAFRGSSSVRDWITNAQFVRRDYFGAGVHAGFAKAFEGVLDALLDAIEKFRRPFWITGHSLGGAVAQLAAWRLPAAYSVPVERCYTYGQPRLGDARFRSRYNEAGPKESYRLINGADIIPRIPGVLMGFRHAGEPRYLFPFTKRLLGRMALPLLLASDLLDMGETVLSQRRFAPLSEHSIQRYIAMLNRP
jgi:pimeloyl-ACP methyl ester carboxylesterase